MWTLKENTVPFTWKTSVISPVPFLFKLLSSDCFESTVMKCFERIISDQFMKHTKLHLDPYQFAYKHNRSTEDATFTMHNAYTTEDATFTMHNAYTHLEKNRFITVRILFIDFSSVFNTIQPQLMASKFLKLDVNSRLIL